MAGKTISQRITLEGSEDIRKQLEALGKAGEQSFKQIQDAAKKPITDPAQIDKTKQAIDQLVTAGTNLGQQFDALTGSAQRFGTAGAQAADQVTTGLKESAAIAGAVAGIFQAATTKLIGMVSQLRAALAPSALREAAVKAGTEISDQAGKIGASIPEMLAFRKALESSSLSADDFVKSGEKIAKMVAGAQGGVARLSDTVTETVSKFGDATVKILRFNDRTTQATGAASQMASELVKLGVPLEVIARGNTLEVMKSLAAAIGRMPDELQRAAAGTKFFGENWKEMVKVLTAGEFGKAARDLTADQVKAAKELKDAWDDLGKAVSSLKANIGANLLGTGTTKFFTDMVDRVRALVQEWGKLSALKKPAFLAELGDSPAEFLFKTLIALGEQLSSLWNDVLVPAGQKLVEIFGAIAKNFEGISGSQVAAFFITAAAAAVGLSLALGAIQLILAPLLALFSPFGAVLLVAAAAAVRFWGALAAGAQRAAALIPSSLALIQAAIRSLFAGNFAKAWAQLAEGASAAFATLTQAALRAQGPIGAIARGLQRIATDFPAAVRLIVAALVGLGVAATGVADIINKIFGTQLTGTDIALIAIVLQLTGGLAALAAAATIVGAAIGALVALFGGPLTIAILAVIAAFALWPEKMTAAVEVIRAGLQLVADGMNALIAASQTAMDAVVAAFAAAWEGIKAAAQATWDFIVSGSNAMVSAITSGIATLQSAFDAAWSAIRAGWDATIGAIQSGINAVIGSVQSLVSWLQTAFQWLQNLLSAQQQSAPTGSVPGGIPEAPGMARGGYVHGPGSATSDSVLARLSRGEFVMNAAAVKHFGSQFFAALNALRRPPGFAAGGMVGSLPRFAAGGMVPALAGNGRNLGTLRLGLPDGTTHQVQTSEETVQALERVIRRQDAHSAGRKPSWY
jgi:hypothetical protein